MTVRIEQYRQSPEVKKRNVFFYLVTLPLPLGALVLSTYAEHYGSALKFLVITVLFIVTKQIASLISQSARAARWTLRAVSYCLAGFLNIAFLAIWFTPGMEYQPQAPVTRQDTTIVVPGSPYTFRTVLAMEQLLWTEGCDGVSSVELSGPGGNNIVADYLINRLNGCGVQSATATGQYCVSSCSAIWANFADRRVGEVTELGFHRSGVADIEALDSTDDIASWYGKAFDPSVVQMIARTPHQEMCFLDQEDLAALGMLSATQARPIEADEYLSRCSLR